METDEFQLQQFLPYLLNQAAEVSSLEFQQIYKDRYGMLRTEWRVLFHLCLYGRRLLYPSYAAADPLFVDLGGRRHLKKKKQQNKEYSHRLIT